MMKVSPSSYCLSPPTRLLKASTGGVGLAINGIKSSLWSTSVRSMSSRPGSLIVGGGEGDFGKSVSSMMMHQAAAVAAGALDEEGEAVLLPKKTARDSPCLLVSAGFLIPEGEEEASFVKLTTTTMEEEEEEEDNSSSTNDDDYYDLVSLLGNKLVLKKKMKKNKSLWLPWQRDILSPGDAICLGSSHGWLAFIHPRNCSIYLYNPLLNSFPYIPLPPIETLPCVISSLRRQRRSRSTKSTTTTTEFMIIEHISAVSAETVSQYFFKKIVFSSPPPYGYSNDNQGNCTVMAIQGLGTSLQGYHLAFCRIGDASWTALDGTRYPYRDLVYFSDHQLFYALNKFSLEAWDLRDPASPKCSLIIESLPKTREKIIHSKYAEKITQFKYAYLAVSSGDLLMVNRLLSNDEPSYTVSFEVYKLDFLRKEWVYLSSLGDRVLFLGDNYHSSESFSAHDFPAGTLIPNSIYFTPVDITDDYVEGNELGFFNLEDKIIYSCPFFKKRNEQVQPSPAWIVPQP